MKNKTLTALVVFTCLSTLPVAAFAQRDFHGHDGGGGYHGGGGHDGGHREDWHGHAREARAWHHDHWHDGHYWYGPRDPYVAYAPPVVVDPPPYYEPEEPGLNITVPLNFR